MPMSDDRLFKLAKEVDDMKEEIKTIDAAMRVKQEKVCKELKRRGVKAVESADGLKVTMVAGENTSYNMDLALEVLGATRLKRVIKRVIDPARLSQQVQAGGVEAEEVAEFATVTDKTPYISVSGRG